MTNKRRSHLADILLAALRRGLEPRLSADVRREALNEIASLSSDDLRSALQAESFTQILEAFNTPHRTTPRTVSPRPLSRTGIGAYSIASDLRRLLNDAFTPTWYAVCPDIEEINSPFDRCAALASSMEVVDADLEAIARGAAWTQMIPGAALLAMAQAWPSNPALVRGYIDHSLDRGGSRAAIPLRLAATVIDEIAARPQWRATYDEVVNWTEAWVACARIDRLPTNAQSWLHQLRLQVRVGIARRAADAAIPAPRLLALLELTSAAVLIRETGRADLVRAHRAAAGDPEAMVHQHAKHDRDGAVLTEVAIAEILRAPDPATIAELSRPDRDALSWFDEVLSANPALARGLLTDPIAIAT